MTTSTTRSRLLGILLSVAVVGLGACATSNTDVCEEVEAHFDSCSVPVQVDCSGAPPENLEQMLAMSCEELEALTGSDPESAGKADFVVEDAPDSWIGYADTSENSVDWLYSWQRHAGAWFFPIEGVGSALDRPLTRAGEREVADRVRAADLDCDDTVALAGWLVLEELAAKGNYVCRHHATSLKGVLRNLDISANFEMGMTFEGWKPIGHSWVESSCGDAKIVADAYNDIYVRVQ